MKNNLKTLLLGLTPAIWGAIMMLLGSDMGGIFISLAFLVYWGFVSYKLAHMDKMTTFALLHVPTLAALIVYGLTGQGVIGEVAYSFFWPTFGLTYLAAYIAESTIVAIVLGGILMTAAFILGRRKALKN